MSSSRLLRRTHKESVRLLASVSPSESVRRPVRSSCDATDARLVQRWRPRHVRGVARSTERPASGPPLEPRVRLSHRPLQLPMLRVLSSFACPDIVVYRLGRRRRHFDERVTMFKQSESTRSLPLLLHEKQVIWHGEQDSLSFDSRVFFELVSYQDDNELMF